MIVSKGLKVFLMTTNDRYQQYYMEAEESKVYFYKARREDKETIVHDLMTMHIVSIDSHDRKVLCKSRRHFGVTLVTQQGHRKLYFLSYAMLEAGIEYLLNAQGFGKRID